MNAWDFQPDVALSLLSFHALTGSDSTSFLAGHSKKTAFKHFMEDSHLLSKLGKDLLTTEAVQECEQFICKVYNASVVATTNKAMSILFKRGIKAELLPPTSDALYWHIMRAHHQSMVWLKALEPQPYIIPPTQSGWKIEENEMIPILLTLDPIPEDCLKFISCKCKKQCSTQQCGCHKAKLPCTGYCKCYEQCINK